MSQEGIYYDLGAVFFWVTFSLIIALPISIKIFMDKRKKKENKLKS